MNLPITQVETRIKNDIKAINTITITIVAYFLCYIPTILYAVTGFQKGTLPDAWFGFIAWYSLYISSTVNPIIYYLRKSRCRSAFKQFLKDPFGSSDFKEKPNGPSNGERGYDEDLARRMNGERIGGAEACEVERDGNRTRQQHLGKRRKAIAISSIESPEVNLFCEVGEESGYEGNAEKGASNHQQNPCKEKQDETDEGNDKVQIKCDLKDLRKRKQHSSRIKVYSLEVIEMGKTGEEDGEKQKVNASFSGKKTGQSQESLEKGGNGMTAGQSYRKALKIAWIHEEEGQQQEQKKEQEQEQKQNQRQGNKPGKVARAGAGSEAETDPGARARKTKKRWSRKGSKTRSENKRQKKEEARAGARRKEEKEEEGGGGGGEGTQAELGAGERREAEPAATVTLSSSGGRRSSSSK